MINDIMTVFQKEWKEVFQSRGLKGYLFNWIIMVLLIGVYMPITVGAEWFKSPMILLLWSWPGLQLISGIVADSFAGEKERHTLETLLSSHLPDTSILLGKLLNGLVYAGTLFPAALLVGAVTVNLAHPSDGIQFYNIGIFFEIIGLHYLCLFLVATVGMLISMHSNSVRSAYQKIAVAILVLVLAPSLSVGLLSPELKNGLTAFISRPELGIGALAVGVALLVIDVILFMICLGNFKRPQLLAA